MGESSTVTLHPLMRVAFDAAQAAGKAGEGLWDALATYASTEERASMAADGIKRAVQAQIQAAAPSMPADWNPNTVSTFRVYRKLIVDAREYGIAVALMQDGECVARSVGDVRADVKAAREAAKAAEAPAEGGEGKGEGAAIDFDAKPASERITIACEFIRVAYSQLSTLEEREAARITVAALLREIGG